MNRAEERPAVTRQDIAEDLSRLGVGEGDVVFLHSSLKSLGWVDGGAEAVVAAFLDAVGRAGLVIAPTFTFTFALGKMAMHAFDPKETPSRVGKITDTLWRHPDAHRSKHPTHSIAAIGARAEELVAGHERTSTFGRDGPYRRYVDWGAKVIFLGVDMRSNTTLHAIEDWLDMPYMAIEHAVVKGPNGERQVVEVTKSPQGDRDFYRRGSKVERLLEGSGIVQRGKVGAADSILVPARDMVDVVLEGIYEEPTLLLCDRGECDFCSGYRQPTIDHIGSRRPTI